MPVTDYPNYLVSNHGRVKALQNQHTLKITQLPGKYPQVSLWSMSKQKTFQLHRIVADHFLPTPEGNAQLDHIDGDINNNVVANLRWVASTGPDRSTVDPYKHKARQRTPAESRSLFKIRRAQDEEEPWRYFQERAVAAHYYGVQETDLESIMFDLVTVSKRKDVDSEFRSVPGTDYEVTADGVLCKIGTQRILRGELNGGYVRTGVRIDGKTTTLHRLILLAWVGPPPGEADAFVANHRNGINLDNRAENLEWQPLGASFTEPTPRSILVHKFDLDGSFLATIPITPKITQAISGKWNHCEGYIYSYDRQGSTIDGSAIRKVFPDYNRKLHGSLDLDKIRPYVIRDARPVAQWDINGEPLALHDSPTSAAAALGVTPTTVSRHAREESVSLKFTKFGYLRYATVEDVSLGLQRNTAMLDEVHEAMQVRICKAEQRRDLDYNFLRDYLRATVTRPRPVFKIQDDHVRVRYFSAATAEKELGLGRASIDQAIRKGSQVAGCRWEWADFALV